MSAPRRSHRRIATVNVAMLPFQFNQADFESIETRAQKLTAFLIAKNYDVICCQEVFGMKSGRDLFIAAMQEKGYEIVDKGSYRSGVVTFYKKSLEMVQASFSPHLSTDRHFSVESIAKKGLLVCQFRDKTTNEVFTVANTHLTGGFTHSFPFGFYSATRIREQGSTSEMRNRQFKHIHKVLKHLHSRTPDAKGAYPSYMVFAGDTNQDMTFQPNGKEPHEWDLQIGISNGKGLLTTRNATKYSGPRKFYAAYEPVIPENYRPKKVVPSIKHRLDPLHPYSFEDDLEGKYQTGTDTGSGALAETKKIKMENFKYLARYDEEKGEIQAEAKIDDSQIQIEKHFVKQENSIGKLLDVMTFTDCAKQTKEKVTTQIVDTDDMSDHQAIEMEIEEDNSPVAPENLIYSLLVNLKWDYLVYLETHGDEAKAELCLDALNRLLDRVKDAKDNNSIYEEIVKTKYLISLDDPGILSSRLSDIQRDMNYQGNPIVLVKPILTINDQLSSAQEVSDFLVDYLKQLMSLFEGCILTSRLDQREARHYHQQLLALENLIEQIQNPHLVEG